MNFTKIEIGAALTFVGMLIAATVTITEIRVTLNGTKERVASLERGSTIESQKNEAIKGIKTFIASLPEKQIPTGTIFPFYGGSVGNVPEGFLLCDGSQITRMMHPVLYQHLVESNPALKISEEIVKLPDMKGQFLRGASIAFPVVERGGRDRSTTTKNGNHQHSHKASNNGVRFARSNAENTFKTDEIQGHEHDVNVIPPFVSVNFIIKD